MAYIKKNKKNRIESDVARVYIKSGFNNTIVSVTTTSGDVLLNSSAGKLNYKGTKKGTPFAASQVGSSLAKEMHMLGIKNIEVNMQGIGGGRDSVIRAMQGAGFNITVLKDVTPIAFGGCRAPKRRRM
jgi:small subunit ribosomal protein S11